LQENACENLKRHALPAEIFWPLREADFVKAVQATRSEIPGLAQKLVDQIGVILRARREIQSRVGASPTLPTGKPKTFSDLSQLNVATRDAAKPVNVWAEELEALLPRTFLLEIPFAKLAHVPRYLKALALRMERAKLNPVKDRERAALVAPYLWKLKTLRANLPKNPAAKKLADEFRWLVEEYKVSVFAQEVGTAQPVSPKRLDEKLSQI
jgi:ATP-dependent helicase HrpA